MSQGMLTHMIVFDKHTATNCLLDEMTRIDRGYILMACNFYIMTGANQISKLLLTTLRVGSGKFAALFRIFFC